MKTLIILVAVMLYSIYSSSKAVNTGTATLLFSGVALVVISFVYSINRKTKDN
jgi:hypothetical protein